MSIPKNARDHEFTLKCDIYLLRKLSEPTTVYRVIKDLDYPNSTAHKRLKDFLAKGIITLVKIECIKNGKAKKLYKLTPIGLKLLDIVEEIWRINFKNDEIFKNKKIGNLRGISPSVRGSNPALGTTMLFWNEPSTLSVA
jgi:DNA-binding PadR family transcriptional regulator